MLVAVSLVAISLSILIYRVPLSTWRAFLVTAGNRTSSAKVEQTSQDEHAEAHTAAEEHGSGTGSKAKAEEIKGDPSPQTTPKATSSAPQSDTAIPTFTLAEHETSDEEEDLPPPSFPALNSAQRASAQPTPLMLPSRSVLMAPPPTPSSMAPPPTPAGPALMLPPKVVPSNLRSLPTSSPSLRVPTTGPLPNRGPAPNRSPNGGLAPRPPVVKTPNARGKVLLSPGHSPLDWANLQRSGNNLAGVPCLTRVTPAMLKHNNGRKGKPAWSSYQGKVFNITPYLPFHPGGEGELRRAAGKDGGKLFMEVHPWVNWENMLGECLVGIMVSEEQTGSLEDMD